MSKLSSILTAIGCPDLKAPSGGKVERDGINAVITCGENTETKFVTCQGSKWMGDIGGCDEGG